MGLEGWVALAAALGSVAAVIFAGGVFKAGISTRLDHLGISLTEHRTESRNHAIRVDDKLDTISVRLTTVETIQTIRGDTGSHPVQRMPPYPKKDPGT